MTRTITLLLAATVLLVAAGAQGSVIVTPNKAAFSDSDVINLTTEGTLGWMTWTGDTNPTGNQEHKASPTTSITYSQTGTVIPDDNNGGWRTFTKGTGSENIDRTWTDGTPTGSGSATDIGPWLNKYDNPEINPSILQFDIDVSSLAAGSGYLVNFYFTQQNYDVDIIASQLDGSDILISGETSSSSINQEDGIIYSSFTISGALANGAQTLRLEIEPDSNGGANHFTRLNALTVGVPEPASLALLAIGGAMVTVRRRR